MERGLGMVYLVGAGPGDAGLITLRGVECLARADLVLYDYLVNAEIVAHAPVTAERICLGRHGLGKLWSQPQIQDRMITAARMGQCVVRLKGGDPAVFARLAEEMDALETAGVPYEIVPGITAALAAASYAGVPLTDRRWASAVALVTGQEDEGKTDLALHYGELAQFPGTLVFYMGVTTAAHWSGELIAAGKSQDTPCVVLRRCSWPDQQQWQCRLGELPELLNQRKPDRIRPPVLVVVGEVAQHATASTWFTRRPLVGQTILITRASEQVGPLRTTLSDLGARVLVQPAIEIGPPPDWTTVDQILTRIEEFEWVVFSSTNGVRYLLQRLLDRGGDLRRLAKAKLAAIGPGTADELLRWNLRADVVPPEFRAECLAAVLTPQAAGRKWLLVRASRGRELLADELRAAGGDVEQVVVYSSTDVAAPDPEVTASLSTGEIDWITVTSSAIARSLVRLWGAELRRARLVSMSPITSATLRELGFPPAAEAREYTMAGVVAAVREAILHTENRNT